MKIRRLLLLLLFFTAGTMVETAAQNEITTDYEKLFDELINLRIDSSRTGSIENYTLVRDAGTYFFESGIVYPCMPVHGKIRAAVFVGKGIFRFTPPTKIEQDQLARFYETRTLRTEFEYVFMLFDDSTFEELEKHFAYDNLNNYDNADEVIKETIRFISDEDKKYFNSYMMKAILEDRQNGFFFSGIEDEEGRLLFFEVDPFSEEEIKLFEGHLFGFNRKTSLDNINSFYASDKSINDVQKYNDLLDIEEYKLNVEIENNADFKASAEISFIPKAEGQKYLNFLMYYKFGIDSLLFNGKNHLKYFKAEENSNLWIEFEDELIKDSLYSFKVFYNGDVLERNLNAWFYLKTSAGWFPRYGTRKYSNYDISFKFPESMELFSVGEKIYETKTEDYKFSRWRTDKKIRNASFNIGSFKKFEYSENGMPKIKVFHSKYGHRRSVKGIENEVGGDVVNAVKYFNSIFGKIDSDSLTVTEIPFYHGEAFPELLHLSFVTFTNTRYSGFDQKFRGHEVAHQWWGIGVDFESYHDQWLSEGFAEYSGLMFLQHELDDDDKFIDILDEYRDEIINNRKQLFWEGQESGPIYLGIRTSGKETQGDYNLIIYRKGAWVLHMLRLMLTDLNTLDDGRFIEMMHEYYAAYKGKKSSTEKFKKLVDEHFNEDMEWFFDQWIYDTFIPNLKFAYDIESTSDRKYIIRMKAALETSYPGFKAEVPVLVKYEDDTYERFRFKLDGNINELILPPVNKEPEEIIFNDLNGLLCEFDYVDWEDID